MCKKSTQKIKFRLVNPDCQRGRIINAIDREDLAEQLTECFHLYDTTLNVFWPKTNQMVGMVEASDYPRWRWKEDPAQFPQSIVDFFDPNGVWAERGVFQLDANNPQAWWTDIYLEIIGGVK